jgi:zinc and cadmium transporter
MLEVIIFSFLIMLASLAGVASIWNRAGQAIERNLRFLVSFSAGVFLVVAYHLGREAVEHAETIGGGFLWILIGAVVIWLVFKIMPGFHHHHDEHEEDHPHSKIDARRILASDAIHNIGDGILLAAAFAVNIGLGVVTAISIFVHELVQEVSEFFVLRQAGFLPRNPWLSISLFRAQFCLAHWEVSCFWKVLKLLKFRFSDLLPVHSLS